MKMKLGGKILVIGLAVAAAGFGLNYAMESGYFKQKVAVVASVPPKVDLPTAPPQTAAVPTPPSVTVPVVPATVPQSVPTFAANTGKNAPPLRVQTLAWNANAGLYFANRGETTTTDSVMAKHGVRVILERQDDYAQMIASMAQFSKAYAGGARFPQEGSAFVIIMGDALPNFAVGLNDALSKYGQQGEAIGMIGFSRGEDKCMLPAEVKTNPQKARGSLIGAVLRDGDAHICFKWASDNAIPINPDEKTYDPDAMNFVAVDSFTQADEKLIAGYCENRPVVRGGKISSQTMRVCQNGTATWTPGDVKVAREKGGLLAVASTREYSYQMPALIIGNKQWMAANADLTRKFLSAALEGSESVLYIDAALDVAASVQATVYKEETAAYWKKYFKGVVEKDRTGLDVSLGGSITAGLADNAFYFGLNGADNIFKRVYTVYGEIDHHYYPVDLPVVHPYESVVNTAYLQSILSKATVMTPAQRPTFSQTAPVKSVVAARPWNIEFDFGKATFTPAATSTLEDMLNQIAVSDLAVQISGHTDSIGNPQANLALSRQRAESVRDWIIANAPSNFPPERLRVRGYGDSQPISDNTTNEGRSKNRRVVITLLDIQ